VGLTGPGRVDEEIVPFDGGATKVAVRTFFSSQAIFEVTFEDAPGAATELSTDILAFGS
jgi:hypothetical protein